jgi:hypothetical protein
VSNQIKVTVDRQSVADTLAAFDDVAARIDRKCLDASYVSAAHIKLEAQARVARRTNGKKSKSDPSGRGGRTARGIVVERGRTFSGYVVRALRPDMPNLPLWLEKGTKKMQARPFLAPAEALEEGPHERRILEAINQAIAEAGLGS